MLRIRGKSARRLLSHLVKLQRDGEALLELPEIFILPAESRWEVRVWKCLDRIAGPRAFESAVRQDAEEMGPIDLLAPYPMRTEVGVTQLVQRRIQRPLITLASVIEKVEALAEVPRKRTPGRKTPSGAGL